MSPTEHQSPPRRPRHRWLWPSLGAGLFLGLLGGILTIGPRLADRWHDSQPTFTALRPAATVPIHPQSVPYAALANLSKVLVGTGSLEVLGIPAAHRYPDCATSFAHNP